MTLHATREDTYRPTPEDAVLDYYRLPSPMTALEGFAPFVRTLPDDPAGIVGAVQKLLIYEHVAEDFYGVKLPPARREESHIRAAADMLRQLTGRAGALTRNGYAPPDRLCGICRHFALAATALMRAKGIPARLRGGFGTYFNPGYFEDHWVTEYWIGSERRWALADPQFDAVWVERFRLDHDMMDVPRDRFLTASAAWRTIRSGMVDPDRFGIVFSDLRGLWFAAASLVRDLAALNKHEMLAWDVWGAQPKAERALTEDELAFFDGIAALTAAPDGNFHAMRERYDRDSRLTVPRQVYNALRQRHEDADER